MPEQKELWSCIKTNTNGNLFSNCIRYAFCLVLCNRIFQYSALNHLRWPLDFIIPPVGKKDEKIASPAYDCYFHFNFIKFQWAKYRLTGTRYIQPLTKLFNQIVFNNFKSSLTKNMNTSRYLKQHTTKQTKSMFYASLYTEFTLNKWCVCVVVCVLCIQNDLEICFV